MNVTMNTAKSLVMDVLRAGLVPFLQSSPGIGKSSLAAEIAKDNNLEFIDVRLSQMDPADLQGFPMKMGDKAGYVPMNIFPIEGDSLPENKSGWLLLLDEFNSSPMATQAAAYKLVLDKMVGMHKLHKRCVVMAAGNLMTDKAIVNRISTAMQSRLIHFTIEVDHKAWIKWADKNGIDHRVKSFINFKPKALYNFDPNHTDSTFPCPRTHEFVSRLIKEYKEFPATKLPLLAGAVGEGMAREMFAFFKIYAEIPTINDIMTNPEHITLSSEPSVQYALTGLVSHHLSEKNTDKLMLFLNRLNIDFQIIALRSAIARNPEIKTTQALRSWVTVHAKELI
jgi:hypothetical protein